MEGKGCRATTKLRKPKGHFWEAFRRKKQASELARKESSLLLRQWHKGVRNIWWNQTKLAMGQSHICGGGERVVWGRTPIYESFDFASNPMDICFVGAKKELFSKFKLHYYLFKSEYKLFVIAWLILDYFYPNSNLKINFTDFLSI